MLTPGKYVRLEPEDEARVERHAKEMRRDASGKITLSDALRDLVRRGLDEADVERGRRARRRR